MGRITTAYLVTVPSFPIMYMNMFSKLSAGEIPFPTVYMLTLVRCYCTMYQFVPVKFTRKGKAFRAVFVVTLESFRTMVIHVGCQRRRCIATEFVQLCHCSLSWLIYFSYQFLYLTLSYNHRLISSFLSFSLSY